MSRRYRVNVSAFLGSNIPVGRICCYKYHMPWTRRGCQNPNLPFRPNDDGSERAVEAAPAVTAALSLPPFVAAVGSAGATGTAVREGRQPLQRPASVSSRDDTEGVRPTSRHP